MSNADHLRVIEGEAGRPPSKPPPDPLVGRTIDGRYLVENVLGEGGMGLVYKARHTVLGKPLAIKVLRPEVSGDDEMITRFRQEAQSASAIGNQHIIDISDFGTLPDRSTYFVMEFLDGRDLSTAIEQENPMDPRRAMHVSKQLCTALGAAHDAGIVHRDLKPDNIYLIRRGGDSDFVKVLDFGIAKVGSGTAKLTKAGQVFGTPHYMSPEQCAGSGTDHRTDIYALGVILYEMACGKVPFDADNLMGVLTKHMYENPVPPHELPPPVNVPPALEAIILKCLAKTPDTRYQTMAEVSADLVLAEQGQTPRAVLEAVERSSAGGAAGERRDPTGRLIVTVGEPDVLPTRSKVPLLLGVGAVLGLIGAIGIGVAAMSGGDEVVVADPVVPPPVVEEAPVAPVQEPVQNDENVEEVGSASSTSVTISSVPPQVEIWRGDELLGNTPLPIPRPGGDERLELVLRNAGYVDQPVRISSLTAENVRITLEQEERHSSSRRGTRGSMRTTMTSTTTATGPAETPPVVMAPVEAPAMMRTRTTTEVLDPWGDG